MQDLFFYSSKIIWMLLSPEKLFLLLLVISLIALLLNAHALAKKILFLLTSVALILSFFRVGSMMLYPLESRFQHNPELPQQIDGIIVLGGSILPRASAEWDQLETNSAHERLSAFVDLAHRYPDARLVFTGGSASLTSGVPREADLVKDYFISKGIQHDRLLLERESRNTAENALFTHRLVQPQRGQNWLLITTAAHMPRSVGLFCKQNWPVIAYPVDHDTVPSLRFELSFAPLDNANLFIQATREWAGLLAYYLTGKIDDILPDSCR